MDASELSVGRLSVTAQSLESNNAEEEVMFTYYQTSGKLHHNGAYIATGYSGAGYWFGAGRNNPNMQCVTDKGPIPVGLYTIGLAYHHPHLGPVTMNLEPVGSFSLCRTLLRIHGDNAVGDASTGCIVLKERAVREYVANSGDFELEVR